MAVYAYKNSDAIEPAILLERAFIYADGFFETIRISRGYLPLLDYHLDRMQRAGVALKLPLDREGIKRYLLHLVAAHRNDYSDAVIKLIIGRGASGRASYPAQNACLDVFALLRPLSAAQADPIGVNLITASTRLPSYSMFSGHKLINRLAYNVAAQDIQIGDRDELLFLNTNDAVVETMHHNIFFMIADTLYTPNLDGFGVLGVMRRTIIDNIALSLQLQVQLGNYSLDDLKYADSVFICNAVSGLTEVIAIDGETINRGAHFLELDNKVSKLLSGGAFEHA